MSQEETGNTALRYSDEALQEFKKIFQEKLQAAEAELLVLNRLIEVNNKQDAERADKEMEMDQLRFFVTRHQELIAHLEKSLKRIEDKTFGVCRKTGRLIEREKLLAVPHGKKFN